MKNTQKRKDNPGILVWVSDFMVDPIRKAIMDFLGPAIENYLKPQREPMKAEATKRYEEDKKVEEIKYFRGIPKTSAEAYEIVEKDAIHINIDRLDAAMKIFLMELVPFIDAGIGSSYFWQTPRYRAEMEIATEYFRSAYDLGIKPWLQRYWLKQYKPFVPPIDHLRLMAVREAFPVEPGLPQYKEMEKWALEMGMDPYWTERYLYMGFERMDVRDAERYFMYWRYDPKGYEDWLRIADIHPDDRPRVAEVAFRPPGVREIGYGYDVGAYDIPDIETFRRKAGQSPEDAAKSARAMVAYRTEAEREALRREALYDHTEGLDTIEDLRRKLTDIGGRPEIIDLWVARAEYRAAREALIEEIKLMRDAAVKGWIDMTDLEVRLQQLNVQRWKIDQIKAYVTLRRKVDPEVVRLLTPAQVGRLYREKRRPRDWALKRLLAMDYPREDAEAFLELYEPEEAD